MRRTMSPPRSSTRCQSMTSHTGSCISLINSDQLRSLAAYSDMLHIGLHRLHNIALPLVSVPLHVLPLCLFVCLFTFVPQHHMLLALFVYFPFQIVSIVDRQQADIKSNCTHCIRRGLGRRFRSSLLLNSSSPRCNPVGYPIYALMTILLLALVGMPPLVN